jgi:hypothetical protein
MQSHYQMAGDARRVDLQRNIQNQFDGENSECENFLTRTEQHSMKWTNFSQQRNLFFDAFNRFDKAKRAEKFLDDPKMSAGNVGDECRRKMSAAPTLQRIHAHKEI